MLFGVLASALLAVCAHELQSPLLSNAKALDSSNIPFASSSKEHGKKLRTGNYFASVVNSTGTASTLPPLPGDLSTPVQQRLAYNGATGMTVAWNTFRKVSRPTVHYGLTPFLLDRSASSSSSVTYPTSRTWANTVAISGILPGTTYYYKIDSTNSTMETFSTARVAGDLTPFTTAVVIDLGVSGIDGLGYRNETYTGKPVHAHLRPGEHSTIDRLVMDKNTYDFVIHPGDFAYADVWLDEVTSGYINGTIGQGPAIYEGLNEQFFDQLARVSKQKPYLAGVGNHEANCIDGASGEYVEADLCPPGQTNFTGFINRFGLTMPRPTTTPLSSALRKKAAALARPPFWYSFDYGMAHFVMFDTETDLGDDRIGPDEKGGLRGFEDGPFGSYKNQQIDFLHADLASVDRKLTPWVIVAGHRPWYTSNLPGCTVCQEAFEGILNQYNVDVAFFGHVHNLERINPIAFNKTDPAGLMNPKAPLYIIAGGAGQFEGLSPIPQSGVPSYVSFAYADDFGFAKIHFEDRHRVTIDLIRSDDGKVVDSAQLYKQH